MKARNKITRAVATAIVPLLLIGAIVTLAAIHKDPPDTRQLEHVEAKAQAHRAASQERAVLAVLRRYAAAYGAHSATALRQVLARTVERTAITAGSCATVSGVGPVLAMYEKQFQGGAGTYTFPNLSAHAVRIMGFGEDEAIVKARYHIAPDAKGPIEFKLNRIGDEGWHITQIGAGCSATPTAATRRAGTTRLTTEQWNELADDVEPVALMWLTGGNVLRGVIEICHEATTGPCVEQEGRSLHKLSRVHERTITALRHKVSGTCSQRLGALYAMVYNFGLIGEELANGESVVSNSLYLGTLHVENEALEDRLLDTGSTLAADESAQTSGEWGNLVFGERMAPCRP